jgi:hypothetical protein
MGIVRAGIVSMGCVSAMGRETDVWGSREEVDGQRVSRGGLLEAEGERGEVGCCNSSKNPFLVWR